MRFIFLVCWMIELAGYTSVYAQIHKGSWIIGGQMALNASSGNANPVAFKMGLQGMYTFSENHALGIIGSDSVFRRISNSSSGKNYLQFGIVYRYHIPFNNRFGLHFQPDLQFGQTHVDSKLQQGFSLESTTSAGFHYLISPSIMLGCDIPLVHMLYQSAENKENGLNDHSHSFAVSGLVKNNYILTSFQFSCYVVIH